MADSRILRRRFFRVMGVPAAIAVGLAPSALAQAPGLRPTPSCGGGPTPPQTEGPYFKPASPRRTSLLEPGMTGTKLVVSGRVLSADCTPVVRALIDAWQADARGEYDNVGFMLRGHQFTDERG